MEPVLTLYDEGFRAYADVVDFELDLAFGADENDFELRVRGEHQPVPHGYIGIVGTEYGGVVDAVRSARDGSTRSAVWSGRTWHGVLDSKVLCPDAGADYLEVEGAAGDVMGALIDRMGLGGILHARGGGPYIERARIDRYATGWEAACKLMASAGCRCALVLEGSAVAAEAVPVRTVVDDAGGSIGFDAVRDMRPVNHLIGLGSGVLSQRVVTHWYADENGDVSQRQTLFGEDERAEVYDYNNAELEELDERTREKLVEMQDSSTASVEVEEARVGIGDAVVARDDELGIEVAARVSKVVVKASGGAVEVEYETGAAESRPVPGGSGGGGGEQPGGAPEYRAGRGLRLDGRTFSAEVAAEDLQPVASAASRAERAAADAMAAAGASVAEVRARSPVTAVRSGREVAVGIDLVGADEANGWFA